MSIKKSTWILLIVSLSLCLFSGIFASMIQTDFYKVEVIDVREDLGDGVQYSGLLFKPKDASEDNKLPAIVLSHGYLNNREMQDQNAVELARRGFIVFTVDRLGHGHSALPSGVSQSLTGNSSGMVNAVEWLYQKDYVDQTEIGISGHSMGGFDTSMTLAHYAGQEAAAISAYYEAAGVTAETATETQLEEAKAAGDAANKVGAALIQAWDGFYGAGSRTKVGNLAAQYDEFFYKENTPGSDEALHNAELDPTDPNYENNLQYEYLPKDFYKSPTAKRFISSLYSDFDRDAVEVGEYYTASGVATFGASSPADEPFRVIYTPDEIHPRNHFSTESSTYVTDFFYSSFGVPSGDEYLEETNQVWWLKEGLNFVGLIGFFMLLIPVVDLFLATPLFNSLKKEPAKAPELKGWKRHLQFWLSGAAITLIAGFMIRTFYLADQGWGTHLFPLTARFPQPTTNPVAVWAVAIGIISLIIFFIGYALVGRKEGDQPGELVKISGKTLGKSILLTFTVVASLYVVLFLVDALFKTDFRLWSFDIRTFEKIKVATIIRYSLVFAVFYVINAFMNANNRFSNVPEWMTIALSALFNVFGICLVIAIQYITFKSTGALWQWDMALGYIVLFPLIPILILAAVFARLIYLRTGNIWLAGFINALLFTAITVANTSTDINYILF